jgi:hypothetical protein
MFVYRPPKSSCWGHSIGKDSIKAKLKLDAFFDAYFERVGSQGPTTLITIFLYQIIRRRLPPDKSPGPTTVLSDRGLGARTDGRGLTLDR